MLLERLERLGAEFEAIWAHQRGRRSFASAAHAYLASATLPPFSWDEVEHYALRTGNHSTFGDLNLRPYRSEAFGIEVLIWGSGSPDIHSHSFSGAFRVVEGGSVHATYAVDRIHWSSPHLVVGEVALRDLALLRVGDTYPIEPGLGFLHGLYHWHDPSVTVVLRTKDDEHHPYQFGVADPNVSPQVLATGREIAQDPQLRAFRKLLGLRPWPDVERVLLETLDALPAWRLWAIYCEVGPRLSAAARQTIIAALPPPLRELSPPSPGGTILRQRRGFLRTDRARIVAGLTLLASNRSRAIAALAEAFPADDPETFFAHGAAEMFGAILPGDDDGLMTEVIVRDVLARRDIEHSLASLREAFSDDSLSEHARSIFAYRDLVAAHLDRFATAAAD